ncbi:MAG TPA: GTPase [archaeon]|nr:GTPase [archaeon]
MPVNAGAEYFAAEKRYLEARTREEKIAALEEMIRTLPKHKGSEHLLSQLKHRLARLKKETTAKATSKPRFVIRKEGAAQICIIGLTNSGKSSLLKSLTNANVEIADYPYTTKDPEVGMMNYGDVQLQLIEIPSTFDSEFMSLLHSCDEIVALLDANHDLVKQKEELEKILIESKLENKKILWVVNKAESIKHPDYVNVSAKDEAGLDELKEKLWKNLSLIKVYTKSPGKPKDFPALALSIDSKVSDVAKNLHKDFIKNFNYARVFNSTKFSGQKVGLEYELRDLDVIEIHMK